MIEPELMESDYLGLHSWRFGHLCHLPGETRFGEGILRRDICLKPHGPDTPGKQMKYPQRCDVLGIWVYSFQCREML